MKTARRLAAIVLALCAGAVGAADGPVYVPIAGGVFRTALPNGADTVTVDAYQLRRLPVTRAEFAAFLAQHPEWRRENVARVFAAKGYLADFESRETPAAAPVTGVSWYGARAYCESEGARLPSWYEWEFAAAADARRRDARDDPAWREQILAWYATPTHGGPGAVGAHEANAWGVQDMHGLIWEWVDDFNGLFVTVDSRSQGEEKTLETCGAAALSLGDRENYAVLMRIALLASLDARDTVGSMGFRCAK
jgi:formylglycine-generating enzyme required for sulfatase activity